MLIINKMIDGLSLASIGNAGERLEARHKLSTSTMKGKKTMKNVWIIENYEKTIGVFSSKQAALDSIIRWGRGIHGKYWYSILDDLSELKNDRWPEHIHIEFENKKTDTLFLHRTELNNGAGLSLLCD